MCSFLCTLFKFSRFQASFSDVEGRVAVEGNLKEAAHLSRRRKRKLSRRKEGADMQKNLRLVSLFRVPGLWPPCTHRLKL